MSLIVISSSLNPNSKSAILARETYRLLQERKLEVDWLDLREVELPHCDGDKAYANPNVIEVTKKIQKASAIILAVAIYNFDCGSSAKNLLELTGRAGWENKTVAFLCAAGGRSSYMSIMSFANSLMLDFRSVIVPRFVYAEGSAFENNAIIDEKIKERVIQMIDATIKLDHVLSS
jgi:NAD(P)H-dependent FMN reductase